MSKICVIGLGYIGLPTATMFATHGYNLVGVDINPKVVESLKQGKIHIELEHEMNELIQKAIKSKNFIIKSKPEDADVFIICVSTLLNEKEKKAELKYVISATESILPYIKKGNIIILESTSPPGTILNVVVPIIERVISIKDVYVAHCPERVIPGNMLKEFINNDRIIGGINKESSQKAKEIYESFVKGNIYLTDATTAEMVKLMENTYRDVNIALANEFAKICEDLNINVWEAIELANKHPRVNIHKPGPGVGGHCIPIVPWFIIEKSLNNANLIPFARHINTSMPNYIVKMLEEEIKHIKNPVITIFGVAFKSNIDDISETPAIPIIELLEKKNYQIKIYDPFVKKFKYNLSSLNDAVKDSDCILIVTDHDDFKSIEINKIGNLMRNKILVDTRNCVDYDKWKLNGFKVKVLGIPEKEKNKNE
ncbi:MAG: UDP-N-acetyl-D-mannosamine dehydrogenase [Candidatus Altarchaeum sp. CG12_big_fil_rev_8_21_14_0_65_33_22]|nr:MAG: UDP-N-acetyl-D-mannosamine dehydrogenase [Candidatus Altarchaeum sp. CG12_big_fil_rev_8_21_14_0_65_33_22]PIV28652.1 MAG: UDP-N-acetyl-D-mannosamine dehydrogenase [Candidatus Altarchaeum sp. CG03_land_8_20_14_0_80_32_618]PIX48816.1 MAG: UDP-N-acetyl-D-mannosamine dehydrogenase [Candidatus Altarchaeum sp. CG_4_8_14_3_um_filter_33_2054]